MIFLADESVDGPIIELLREDGHEVPYIAELAPGIGDEEVLERSRQEGRILLTADKDFGELVYRRKQGSVGVILIRLSGLPPRAKANLCARRFGRARESSPEVFRSSRRARFGFGERRKFARWGVTKSII